MTIAGRFRVDAFIGEGGMGRVYRATQSGLNKTVCLKILHRSHLNDERSVLRFEREALAASRLNHPNSIVMLDVGACDDGARYIAMEYVAGENLQQLLAREGTIPEARAIRIVSQVLAALGEAHAAGVIHRDVKPENIMVEQRRGEPDFVKVLDFGIAKVEEAATEMTLTGVGFVCGTPEYMSPEQARGSALDSRSDLYSVGVVLYQCLTGVPVFQANSAVEVATAHLMEVPVPPRERRPDLGISESMNAIVLATLAKDRADRPQSADELRAALLALADRASAPGGVTGRVAGTSHPVRPSIELTLRGTRPRLGRTGKLARLVAVLLALAACAGVGSLAFSRITGEPFSFGAVTQLIRERFHLHRSARESEEAKPAHRHPPDRR